MQWSPSPDFLVKRQWHNWSSIFTSDWLSDDPYSYLHSAIWILMKVNGIISISKCVWYTERKKREKTFVYNLYTKKAFGREQKEGVESFLECGKVFLVLLHKLVSQYWTVYNQEFSPLLFLSFISCYIWSWGECPNLWIQQVLGKTTVTTAS